MEKNIEDDKDFHKIKIFSSEDEKLKMLGELLSNKSSRDIIKMLIEKEHYTNEIASKLDIRVNLVIHHLKKLEALGLLLITEKVITKKGIKHRFFRIMLGMLVLPNNSKEDIEHEGILKRIFKDGIKFAVVGLTAIATWYGVNVNSNLDGNSPLKIDVIRGSSNATSIYNKTVDITTPPPSLHSWDISLISFIVTGIVIISGLFLIWYSKKNKKVRVITCSNLLIPYSKEQR